jgi:hypothetical protein
MLVIERRRKASVATRRRTMMSAAPDWPLLPSPACAAIAYEDDDLSPLSHLRERGRG